MVPKPEFIDPSVGLLVDPICFPWKLGILEKAQGGGLFLNKYLFQM